MNKVIKGKRYDTDTAKRLCGWSPSGDYANEQVTLYRKRTGECFLERWHSLHGGKIVPLCPSDARECAEAHMDADEYEAAFGPVGE